MILPQQEYYVNDVESKKWYKWMYLQDRNRLTDIENKLMATRGEMSVAVGVIGKSWGLKYAHYCI